MRVIAGELRGRRLAAPRGSATRPTADRVREALFSILGDVSGARVLDLYAGSGALGIEALSRGAAEATFVERAREAAETIRSNLASLGIDGTVHVRDVGAWLADPPGAPVYDLVFADPPYDSAPVTGPLLAERLAPVLSPEAVIVTESDKRAPLELPFELLRERTYGDTRVAVHRHG